MNPPSSIASVASAGGAPITLSVVVPCFNEEEALPLLHERLLAVIGQLPGGAEIVYVNDGSRDGTGALLKRLRASCPLVSAVSFSRNFGKEQAITAGLHLARGNAVIVMDSDLQHPPELIPAMLQE